MEGVTLEEYFAPRLMEADDVRESLNVQLESVGLESGYVKMIYNTKFAHEFAKWVETKNISVNIHNELYKAHFVYNVNYSDINILSSMAEKLGLSGDEARDVLTNRDFKESVENDWKRAKNLGIALPTYITEKGSNVGHQPYERMKPLLKRKK